jgi:competence protein ComEA
VWVISQATTANNSQQQRKTKKEKRRKDPMRKSQTIALIALVIMSIAGSALADAVPASQPGGVVNINTADVAQLSNLPRIGAKAAQRIIDYRAQHGAFQKKTDLMQVKGVGEKSFNLLSPFITVEGKTTLTSKVSSPRKSGTRQKPAATASK